MYFVSFYVDCAERPRWAEILACSASYAACFVDGGYPCSELIVGVEWYHLYCSRGAVALAVAAADAIGDGNAVFAYPHGVAYLRAYLLGQCYWLYCSCGAHFRAAVAFWSAISALVAHCGLHELLQVGGRSQHFVGALCHA